MKKEEFIEAVKIFNGKLGIWQIEIGHLSMADYILGCYFDTYIQEWKVYKNGEKGMHSIRLSTPDEDSAFDKLFSMIKYEYKVIHC